MSRDHTRLWFNAAVFLGCLLALGLDFRKSLIVAVVVLISCYVNYGTRWLMRAGFVLLVVTVLVTIEVLPEPREWRQLSQKMIDSISTMVESVARS